MKILWRLSPTIYPVLIQASMNMGSIVVSRILSFLGFGAPQDMQTGARYQFRSQLDTGDAENPLAYWYSRVSRQRRVVRPGMESDWNAFRDIMDPKIQS